VVYEVKAQGNRIISEQWCFEPMPLTLNIHEDRKPKYSCFTVISRLIITRIVVIYKSHMMPDADSDKNQVIAKMASRHIWGGDFDGPQGRLRLY
jgi:hypothetical protein